MTDLNEPADGGYVAALVDRTIAAQCAEIIYAHNDLYHPGQDCPAEDKDSACAARTGKPVVLTWTAAGIIRRKD